jgi:hypothetical protein
LCYDAEAVKSDASGTYENVSQCMSLSAYLIDVSVISIFLTLRHLIRTSGCGDNFVGMSEGAFALAPSTRETP